MAFNNAIDLYPRVLDAFHETDESIRSKLAIVLEDYDDLGANGFRDVNCAIRPVPIPEMAICMFWMWTHAKGSGRRVHRTLSSYGLKHIIEKDAETYIPNGAAIAAASALCIAVERCKVNSPNAYFGMRIPETVDGSRTWPLFSERPTPPRELFLGRFERQRASGRYMPPSLRARILERDNFRCRRCGAGPQQARLVIDHITPVALGGTNVDTNLQVLCEPCNQGKADRLPHPHDLCVPPS